LPLKNLLFDFSLSALNGDYLDAKLYLAHSHYLLGLRRNLVLLLSIIINDPSNINDREVRRLLTNLALLSEPNNIDVHFDLDNDGFSPRYSIYLQEIQKASINNNKSSQLMNIKEIKK
jgi:hypothetical protein